MISPSYVDGLELRIKELVQSNKALTIALDKVSDYNLRLEESNRSFVSALQKAEAYNIQLENERDALAAQVAAYKERSSELYKLCDELIDHLRYNKAERDEVLNEFWNKQEAIKYVSSDPQQCLAEIKAEAGRAGYLAGVDEWAMVCQGDEDACNNAADQYAAKVRQGGE